MLEKLCNLADIITIHSPLTGATRHLINGLLLMQMKKGVMIINTARGAIVNTEDIIRFIDSGHIGFYGMDVYEYEKGVFFYDHSQRPLQDPMLEKLLSYSNVLITPHQAFATAEALETIAAVTVQSFSSWQHTGISACEVS